MMAKYRCGIYKTAEILRVSINLYIVEMTIVFRLHSIVLPYLAWDRASLNFIDVNLEELRFHDGKFRDDGK